MTDSLATTQPRDFLIRPATVDDLPAILEIYNDIVNTSTAIFMLAPVTLDDRHKWYESRMASGYPVLVAERNGIVLGYSSFGDWRGAWGGYRYTVEHSVHVHRDGRGRGVGRALVDALIPLAAERHVHVMIGVIDASNSGALHFHEQLGFERVAQFREVGHKFGRWLDAVFVQRFIDAPGAPREVSA